MLSYHMIIRTVNYVGSVLQRFFQCFLHIFSILFYCQMHFLQRIKIFMQIFHAVCTNDCIFFVRTYPKILNLDLCSIFCPLYFVKSLWLLGCKRLPFCREGRFWREVLGRICGKVTNCAVLTYIEVMVSGNVTEGAVPQPQRSSKALGTGYALPFGKDSRAHRGRNSRLAHRARQDSRSLLPSANDPLGHRFLHSPSVHSLLP